MTSSVVIPSLSPSVLQIQVRDAESGVTILSPISQSVDITTQLPAETLNISLGFIPGPQGIQGPQGPQGPAGPGLASGGTTGQIAVKFSNNDYDTQWTSLDDLTLHFNNRLT